MPDVLLTRASTAWGEGHQDVFSQEAVTFSFDVRHQGPERICLDKSLCSELPGRHFRR